MAKSGTASTMRTTAGSTVAPMRRALVDAAITALREEGFAGASARSIARRAGCNQGLVFYYFGSVVDLLLAALDEVSQRRLTRYSEAVRNVRGPAELVRVAADIFREDLDNGYVTVLVEMIAGAASTPGLGVEVARRVEPWSTFAEQTVNDALADSPLGTMLSGQSIAHAVVALYLGLEMLTHLQGERAPAEALFGEATRLAGVLESLTGIASTPKGKR